MRADDPWTQAGLEGHIRGFEEQTLRRQEWSPHSSHIATTVWYCRRQSSEEALRTMRSGILQINAAIDVPPDAYHETVTRFFVTVIHQLVGSLDSEQKSDAELANEVIAELGTSRDERMALFERYWRDPRATLLSDAARRGWVPPDIGPWPPKEASRA